MAQIGGLTSYHGHISWYLPKRKVDQLDHKHCWCQHQVHLFNSFSTASFAYFHKDCHHWTCGLAEPAGQCVFKIHAVQVVLEDPKCKVSSLNECLRLWCTHPYCLTAFLSTFLLNTELLKRSEHQSTSVVDVGGAEFSRSDILQQSLKGLGFNLCVVPHFNGLVVPDFRCQNKCQRQSWR